MASHEKQQSVSASSKGLDRRGFLKASTALGAGLVLAPHILKAEEPGPAGPPVPASEQINVAIIGCGQQGRVLMESTIKESPGVRFKAVCDIWPYSRTYMGNLLTKKHKHDVTGHTYEDYKELLDKEKDIQAVIVASPDWVHAEHAIACMKAGKHVYCEKEMSNDIAKAKQMVQTSKETGKLLQIGHQRRSNARYILSHDKLMGEAKLLGTVTHAYAQWNRGKANSSPLGCGKNAEPEKAMLDKYGYATMPEFLNWRWYRKYGGGPICDLGSHQIDIFGWFLNAVPKSVVVSGGTDYWKKQPDCSYEWYDNVRAIYDFETPDGPVRALYQVLTTTSALGYYEAFMGVEGTLNISEAPPRCRVFAESWLPPDDKGNHLWKKWQDKGYVTMLEAEKPKEEPGGGGMSDLLKLYKASSPPVQFLMNIGESTTYHGPHLKNFFDAVRGKGKLNCPGEIGYETAVQVLKINQLLDAKQAAGSFQADDFKA